MRKEERKKEWMRRRGREGDNHEGINCDIAHVPSSKDHTTTEEGVWSGRSGKCSCTPSNTLPQ